LGFHSPFDVLSLHCCIEFVPNSLALYIAGRKKAKLVILSLRLLTSSRLSRSLED
jgi:hypothetical protein